MNRIVSWFSHGAASAVATKLQLEKNRNEENRPFVIAYCEVEEEHKDNARFLDECQDWFDHEITILRNEKYNASIYNVFRSVRYLKGNEGAPCTRLLKKEVRQGFQEPTDTQVMGFTVDEPDRIDRFIDANADVDFLPTLSVEHLTKQDCFGVLEKVGIELPAMYKLGYKNNNCIGCVKGGMGYWNKIRIDFPETFDRMAELEREIGASICYTDIKKEKSESGKNEKTLIPLRELPPDKGDYKTELNLECGIFCQMATQDIR